MKNLYTHLFIGLYESTTHDLPFLSYTSGAIGEYIPYADSEIF